MLTLIKVENLPVPKGVFSDGPNSLLTNLNDKLRDLERHKTTIVDYLNYDDGTIHFFIRDSTERKHIKAACFENNLSYCFYGASIVTLNIEAMQQNISDLNEKHETRYNTDNDIVFVETKNRTQKFYILLMRDRDEDEKTNGVMSFLNGTRLGKVERLVSFDNNSLMSQLKTELKTFNDLILKTKKKIAELTSDETVLWINPDKKSDLKLREIEQFCFQHDILMIYAEIAFSTNSAGYSSDRTTVIKQPYLKFHDRAAAIQFKMSLDYEL